MKNELAKHRWTALLAGFLLLVGTATLERTPSAASLIPGVGAGNARASKDAALERGVVAALADKAPRLDPVLSRRIAASIARCGREQSLPPDLVLAVLMQESSGRPGAMSPKGAIGLMQVMPHMYEVLALPGSAAHVEANIEAGCRLLADNIKRLGEERGISQYFWGSANGNDLYLRGVQKLRRDLQPYLDGADENGSTGPIRG
jgi:soluble lytic murein transglycosylase-like protein